MLEFKNAQDRAKGLKDGINIKQIEKIYLEQENFTVLDFSTVIKGFP
jgi:hypothetical protein